MEELAQLVDVDLLSQAFIQTLSTDLLSTVPPELRLWLLAHFISLHRLQGSNEEPVYLRALSILLTGSAAEILGRIDAEESDLLPPSRDDGDEIRNFASPLPVFVKAELVSLVNRESITGLLAKFNTYVCRGGR